MAEFGKHSAFDPARGARTLNQQHQEIGVVETGLWISARTSFPYKTT
ncbi:unnamed protein product, partial [Didymodactylos carnosus]